MARTKIRTASPKKAKTASALKRKKAAKAAPSVLKQAANRIAALKFNERRIGSILSREVIEMMAAAAIAQCSDFFDDFALNHAATIPKGKHVTPTPDVLTRWCRAFMLLASSDLRADLAKTGA